MNYKRTLCCASLLVRHSSKKYSPYSTKNLTKNSSLLPKLLPQLCCSISSQMNLDFKIVRNYSSYNPDDNYQITDIVYENLSVDNFKELIKSDADAKLIGEILASYEVLKYETGLVPTTIKLNQMKELMKYKYENWERTFGYIAVKEILAKNKKKLKSSAPKSATYYELQEMKNKGETITLGLKFDPQTGAPIYGEWLNSHFTRLRRLEHRCSFLPNLLSSYLFGQKLVIDCDFDYTVGDAKRLVHDLSRAFAVNRTFPNPFNFIITGLKNIMLKEFLDDYAKSSISNDGLLGMDIHSESFTELFNDQKFIYLSPYAKDELHEYDDDAIYILGGRSISSKDPETFKKAIDLNLPCYQLPLSSLAFRPMRYAKTLDVTECTKILLNFKETGDIEQAINSGISQNRLKTTEEIEQEQRIRLRKMFSDKKKCLKKIPVT